jgi:DNA-damage-inducible protein J
MYNYVSQMTRLGDTMKTEMLSTRIDHDTKLAFTNVCEGVGLSTSQALKLFAKAVINHGGIPFELKAKTPNALTTAAIEELESGSANKAKDLEQLFDDLDIGNIE